MKPTKEYKGRSNIRMYRVDCMDFMEDCDTYDLAIVDPPYRNQSENQPTKDMRRNSDISKIGDKPDLNYFKSLNKVSKNQIIWGANNFQLPPFKGFVVWKKKTIGITFTMSMCEIASISEGLGTTSKWIEIAPQDPNRIHCNQKPVQLYKWILTNYANEGDKVLDTHGGSMSIAIACWDLGFDLDIIELDEDYFNDAVKRFEQHVSQTQLF
jgi:site-specific DNA-methyltransferase (adenine-specific)